MVWVDSEGATVVDTEVVTEEVTEVVTEVVTAAGKSNIFLS